MIKFKDSEITQILPSNLKYDYQVQAISYVIKKALEKVIKYSNLIAIYAAIDDMPDHILDLLAIESRTQYYDENLSVETKRRLLKNTLIWHCKAGTPSAVEELISTIFGEGEVKEWFEYGGDPYSFKIISDAALDEESAIEFSKMIDKVKNVRSHLDGLEFSRKATQNFYTCTHVATEVHVCVEMEE